MGYNSGVKQLTVLFLTICFFSFNGQLFAQNVSIPAQIPELEEQVSIFVEPELPKPNELIKIKVEAYGTDLTRAFITWKINGVTKKSGRGEQVFELQSGNAGTKQVVSILIQPVGGPLIQKTLTFKPQEVDLLWEARSYTPPFYKGKSLPGYMGKVKVVAVPQFKEGNIASNKNQTFKWRQNYDVVADFSGFNKNSITFEGGILLQPETIGVEVTDDNFNKATKDITINFYRGLNMFYENNPLYGILFNKALSDVTLKGREISLSVIPFFFESDSRKSDPLKFTWNINGNQSFLFNRDIATFRYDSNQDGVSVIDVITNNSKNFLQEARSRINIRLEKNEN